MTTQSSGVQWTESDSRQPSVILNELVKLSRETKGEHFLPSLRREEDKQRKCILCSVKGFRCLGNCCLGKKVLHNPSSGRKFPPPSTSIPGTEGDKSMTTSTLVSLQFFTDSDQSVPVPVCSSTTIKVDKKQIWDIFSWKPVNNGKKVENPDAKTPVHNHQNKKVANFGPAVFDTDDLDKIIKNSRFPKDPHTEKKKDTSFSKSNSTVTSLVRKLEISEKSCPRKNNDPTLPSSSNKLEFGEDQMKDHIPASSSDFKIPKLSSWGHYRVGLCGGSPYDSPTTAQVTSTSSLIPPAISAKIDNYNQFKCEFCNEFSTDTNTKLKRHKVGCKKKNRAKNRGSSIPRNKDDLTKNLAIGDTRESVAFESSPKTLSKLVLGSQNVLDLESSSSSNLNVGRIKLQVKTLKYNEEFHKVLEKSSATLYDKYMLCRAANICVPGMYPFINIRSSSNHYNSTSRYCFTDSKHLIDILKTSSNILSQSDRRRFILADTNIRISDIDIDFRGKELRPNAFMNIEVITTPNPNHIKLVLNNHEVVDNEDPSDNEVDFSWPFITPEGEQISTQHCWGSDGWQGVIKKTKAELLGLNVPEEIAMLLGKIDLVVILPLDNSVQEALNTIGSEADDSEPMESQDSDFLGFKDSEEIADFHGLDNSENMDVEGLMFSPIGAQLDGMTAILPPFVPAIPIPNIPGAPPPIQALHQHLQVPVGPGLPPNGQFGLVPPFAPHALAHIPNASILNCRNHLLATLATVQDMTYKDAEFLFASMLNAQRKFRPLANTAYFPSSLNDTEFHDLTGLDKIQFYDLRNRLEFCGLDFTNLYKGTIDSELFRTLCYTRNMVSQRSLAGLTGISKTKLQSQNWAIIISILLNVTTLPQFLFFNNNIPEKGWILEYSSSNN